MVLVCSAVAVVLGGLLSASVAVSHRNRSENGQSDLLTSHALGASPSARAVVTGRRVGGVTEYPVPVPDAALMIPAIGADNRVWMTAMNTSSLIVFDPLTSTFEELKLAPGQQSIEALRASDLETRYVWECVSSSELGLMGLAIDPTTGAIWFAEQNVDRLGVYDPKTGEVRDYPLPTRGSAPSAVAIDASGRIWATALGVNKIVSLEPSTGIVTEYAIPGGEVGPYSLAVGQDQRVWFSEFNRGVIGMLDPSTGLITEFLVAGSEGTVGIAVDSTGMPWATTSEGRLVGLDPSSGAVTAVTVPLTGRVYGVTVDPAGNIWVGGLSGRLAAFTPAAGSWRVVDMLTPDSSPWWPAAAPNGDIWSVEPGANKVVRVVPEG